MTYSLTKTITLAGVALAAALVSPRFIPVPNKNVSVPAATAPASVVARWSRQSATLQVQRHAVSQQIRANATATIHVESFVPIISLVPYYARPGQSVEVQGQGFAPGEAVRLIVGSAPVVRTRAGADGTLDLRPAYTVPYATRPGFLKLALIGDRSQRAAWQRLDVVPLRPWATASAYVVHPGDRVQFEVNGFAAGETVDVYEGSAYLGHSIGRTDAEGHVAGVGPFAVPAGTQSPTYTFIGTRSGVRLRVTLTVPRK